jgi:hypothetical protein
MNTHEDNPLRKATEELLAQGFTWKEACDALFAENDWDRARIEARVALRVRVQCGGRRLP